MRFPSTGGMFLAVMVLTACGSDEDTSNSNSSSGNNDTNDSAGSITNCTLDLDSDFTPPSGAVSGPGALGPWGNRLLFATSQDGLSFTRSNVLFSDQADVPDLVMDKDGCLYLYYLGWTVGTKQNQTVVGISADQGESWVYKTMILNGFDGGSSAVDPDVQYMSDGTFRLYLTWDKDNSGPVTHVAESSDGLEFTRIGTAFAGDGGGGQILDPNTLLAGDTWHLFAGGNPNGNWHATSSDGLTFGYYETLALETVGADMMAANEIPLESGGFRMFAFSNDKTDIYSFYSDDGFTWEAEDGVRLAFDDSTGFEAEHVKDSSVVQLRDGSYLMAYVSQVP